MESELERNLENIKKLKAKRIQILEEIKVIEPKVQAVEQRRNEIKEILDKVIEKFDSDLMNHKLPLMMKREQSMKQYGHICQKLAKDLKIRREELEIMKKTAQVKMH